MELWHAWRYYSKCYSPKLPWWSRRRLCRALATTRRPMCWLPLPVFDAIWRGAEWSKR